MVDTNTTDGICGWMWIAIGIVFAQVAKIIRLIFCTKPNWTLPEAKILPTNFDIQLHFCYLLQNIYRMCFSRLYQFRRIQVQIEILLE